VLLLINDRALMGEYTNSRWYNVVSWTTVTVLVVLTVAMVLAHGSG
jgi:Mn2+/Fe2+ NRAMP family transporter